MKLPHVLAVALLAAPALLGAQTSTAAAPPPASAPAPMAIPKDLTQYWLATLLRGPKHDAAMNGPAAQDMLRGHLAYMKSMVEQKKYVLFGPYADGANLEPQGIIILSAASADEATKLVSGDPAVVAGHFRVEVRPVMLPSLKGVEVKY